MNEVECRNCKGRCWMWASRNPNNAKQEECEGCKGTGKEPVDEDGEEIHDDTCECDACCGDDVEVDE